MSTFFLNKELASKYTEDSEFNIEENLMQKVGQESLNDPSFTNKMNTGVYQLSIGKFCIQAVRSKTRGDCGRRVGGDNRVDLCSPQVYELRHFRDEDFHFYDHDSVTYEWQRVITHEETELTKFASSNYISGSHGEYDVRKGHFVCLDPYAPSESPQVEL